LDPETLARNVNGITGQVHKFFSNGEAYLERQKGTRSDIAEGGSVKVLNNHDWTKGVSLLDFLRDVGKLAKVNTMIARDRYAIATHGHRHIFHQLTPTLVCAHDSTRRMEYPLPNSRTNFSKLSTLPISIEHTGAESSWGEVISGEIS